MSLGYSGTRSTLEAFGISGAAPLMTVSPTFRFAACGVAALATENLDFFGVTVGVAMAKEWCVRVHERVGVNSLMSKTLRT